MKDEWANFWFRLFEEDKKIHPMPPGRAQALLEKIRALLFGSGKKTKYTTGEEIL